ncbi:MAG: hypothetical protein V1797_04355 [Pseudomonadota bacterium]
MSAPRELSLTFAAGALGGLVNSVFLWAVGQQGLTAALGVKIAPALTPGFLYPRLVWGGIWGFLFLLPFLRRGPVFGAGLLASLGPTAVQLFYIFPQVAHKGVAGVELGLLTPLVVIVVNAVWGVAAAAWLRAGR